MDRPHLRCPWDERLDLDPRGADRFQWSIRAQCAPDEEREADLPDRAVTGPWRELVDAVREWSTGTRAPAPPERRCGQASATRPKSPRFLTGLRCFCR